LTNKQSVLWFPAQLIWNGICLVECKLKTGLGLTRVSSRLERELQNNSRRCVQLLDKEDTRSSEPLDVRNRTLWSIIESYGELGNSGFGGLDPLLVVATSRVGGQIGEARLRTCSEEGEEAGGAASRAAARAEAAKVEEVAKVGDPASVNTNVFMIRETK